MSMRRGVVPALAVLAVTLFTAPLARAQEIPCEDALHGADNLHAFAEEVNMKCCNSGAGGQHRRLQDESCELSTCSLPCATMFIPYFEECPDRMQQLVGHVPGVEEFRGSCAEVLARELEVRCPAPLDEVPGGTFWENSCVHTAFFCLGCPTVKIRRNSC